MKILIPTQSLIGRELIKFNPYTLVGGELDSFSLIGKERKSLVHAL